MRKKLLVVAAILVLVGTASGVLIRRNNKNTVMGNGRSNTASIESHPTCHINLLSGKNYAVAKPTTLRFTVQDQTGKVLKDFATYREYKMHFIVVRTDRTNFQTIYPSLDETNGKFSVNHFTFPTGGRYRILTSFMPSHAQRDAMGNEIAAVPFEDVQVGATSKYTPEPLNNDRLASTTNGINTSFFFPPSDDSAGPPTTDFYAGQLNSIAISIEKNGQLYKSLQPYLGGLGHMIMFGPKLEFVHVDSQADDISNQGGVMVFSANFPVAGKYKIYLQTQTDNQVNTSDYVLTVKPNPSVNSNNRKM